MKQLCVVAALVCLTRVAAQPADFNSVLIRNASVHPVTGPEIQNTSVLILDGRIAEIGPKLAPKTSIRIIDARGLHLYPGLINAATNVGLSEIQALRDTVDLDELGLFNPELRAASAFNPSSEHIEVTRASGITSVVSLPGSGARRAGALLITGQGALMHLDGWTWEEMAVKPGAVMDLLFPEINMEPAQPGAPPRPYKDALRQYMDRLQELSEFFEQARRYQKAMVAHAPDFRRDLRLEAMIPVLEGLEPIAIRAERERAIRDAVAFADKEKVKIIIADPREIGGTGPLLKERHIPVILGRSFQLPMRDDDPYDAPYTLAAQFYRAGVKVCFGTFDVQFARNVGFEAAQAAAFGLPRDVALKALTINSAEILGVGDRLGSIEKGKLGDLILTDGDPLEARTNIKQMFIAGREVNLESRHTREYEKWMKRP
ncbi:MAG TPA: amidohydrolase family protein [Bryobacteraceae bacterium]|jgi:imidazolonepropionase-like amidohydrolase